MTALTDPAHAPHGLRRTGPVVALALTVTTGTLVGAWMALSAVLATPQDHLPRTIGVAHASGPTAAHPDGHVHSDAGLVAMPGLAPEPSPTGGDPMAGMSAEDMSLMVVPEVAASPSPIAGDPMGGMSAEDMAAHSPDAHASQDATGDSRRPLGMTLAGFGVVNLGVLLVAALIGQRRARQRQKSGSPGRRATPRPAPTSAASSTATRERAGNPS